MSLWKASKEPPTLVGAQIPILPPILTHPCEGWTACFHSWCDGNGPGPHYTQIKLYTKENNFWITKMVASPVSRHLVSENPWGKWVFNFWPKNTSCLRVLPIKVSQPSARFNTHTHTHTGQRFDFSHLAPIPLSWNLLQSIFSDFCNVTSMKMFSHGRIRNTRKKLIFWNLLAAVAHSTRKHNTCWKSILELNTIWSKFCFFEPTKLNSCLTALTQQQKSHSLVYT